MRRTLHVSRVLQRTRRLAAVALIAGCCALTDGCSQANYATTDTFFRPEYGLETHGRKTWMDHLIEVDPGGIRTTVAPDYEQKAPARIAVLPFIDQGSAQFVVDRIPLTRRNPAEQANWRWTDSNRLRRAVDGYLSEREFLVENLIFVDQVMKEHHIYTASELAQVPPQTLGRWLGVDAVVYGEVTHYEAFYAALIASWQVGVNVRMVSTHDGRDLFVADGSRYSVDLRPAFDPLDILINSGLSLLELRDITLARAEEENAREIVLRIPRSPRLQAALIEEASEEEPPDRNAKWELTAAPPQASDQVGRTTMLYPAPTPYH